MSVPDRQGVVSVGLIAKLKGDELVARHGAHGSECGGVGHAAGFDLLFDHRFPSSGQVTVLPGARLAAGG